LGGNLLLGGLGICEMEIKPVTQIYICFLAGFLLDPFFIKIFAAIYVNIPWSRQPIMVSDDFTFDVVFSPVNQPPKILGVINNRDRESVGAGRCIGWRGNSSRERREGASHESQEQA
jgi:hypothetical protein